MREGPIPIGIGLPGGIKRLRIEHKLTRFTNNIIHDEWAIWLSANHDFTLGTFIRLGYSGTIDRVTIHPDGTESVFNLIEESNNANRTQKQVDRSSA